MSRHTFSYWKPSNRHRLEVVTGWDVPTQDYFGTIFDLTIDDVTSAAHNCIEMGADGLTELMSWIEGQQVPPPPGLFDQLKEDQKKGLNHKMTFKHLPTDVELRTVKVFQDISEETLAFSAVMYINGRRAALCSNSGTGGMNRIDPRDDQGRELLSRARAMFDGIGPYSTIRLGSHDFSVDMNLDYAVSILAERHAVRKDAKRLTKNNKVVLYQPPDMRGGDVFVQVARPYDAEAVQDIVLERGTDDIYFLNEETLPVGPFRLEYLHF